MLVFLTREDEPSLTFSCAQTVKGPAQADTSVQSKRSSLQRNTAAWQVRQTAITATDVWRPCRRLCLKTVSRGLILLYWWRRRRRRRRRNTFDVDWRAVHSPLLHQVSDTVELGHDLVLLLKRHGLHTGT